MTSAPRRALPWLLLLHATASLVHFVHNAEYLEHYPNLPRWITPFSVYAVWFAIASIGLAGYLSYRQGRTAFGLTLLAFYATLGFGGLLHYGRAPMSAHTFGMSLTIWAEAATAAIALGAVVWVACVRIGRIPP